jgi:hypothetical protein
MTLRRADATINTLKQNDRQLIDKDAGLYVETILSNGDTIIGGDLYVAGNVYADATITTQYDGTTVSAAATTLNFTGAGVTVTADIDVTTVDIPGGGGGSLTNIVDATYVYGANALWTFDPVILTNGNSAYFTNYLFGTKIYLQTAQNISTIQYKILSNTAVFTTGQCFIGVYQAGNLIASSADMAATWQGAGNILFTTPLLGAPIAVSAGSIYIVSLWNSSSGSFYFHGYVNSATGNVNYFLQSPNLRSWVSSASGFTALPLTLPAQVAHNSTFFLVT